MPSDFPAAFGALREILKKHSAGMTVLADTPTDFSVITKSIGPNKKPMWFGAVMSKKSAVTFHLLPLYYNPKLQAIVPPELLKRKQGKACFNFQRPDAELLRQLDAVTKQARQQWERAGFLKEGPISKEQMSAALRAAGEDPEAITALRKTKAAEASAKRAATKKKKLKT